jgi:hypothetical protein
MSSTALPTENSAVTAKTFERTDVVLQERPQPGGRRVLFSIGLIGIDKVFEETEHGKNPKFGAAMG